MTCINFFTEKTNFIYTHDSSWLILTDKLRRQNPSKIFESSLNSFLCLISNELNGLTPLSGSPLLFSLPCSFRARVSATSRSSGRRHPAQLRPPPAISSPVAPPPPSRYESNNLLGLSLAHEPIEATPRQRVAALTHGRAGRPPRIADCGAGNLPYCSPPSPAAAHSHGRQHQIFLHAQMKRMGEIGGRVWVNGIMGLESSIGQIGNCHSSITKKIPSQPQRTPPGLSQSLAPAAARPPQHRRRWMLKKKPNG